MNRNTIYKCFEEITRKICFEYDTDIICFPEKVINYMVNDFIARYNGEYIEILPRKRDVINAICNYIQNI